MAGSTVNISVVASVEQAQRALQQVQRELDKVGTTSTKSDAKMRASAQRMVGAGKKLSLGLTAPVVAFGALSVRAFAESQTALAKLQNTLENSPKLAGESIESFKELASAIQQKTAADDESVLTGAAVLGQFKLTGEQIRGVLPLIVDYARKTGQDVPGAAQNIGRALLGNTRALKAVGISYTSTGDAAKDFDNITRLLAARVGGFAEKEATTAAGKLEMMKNRFNELQEQVGSALMPLFETMLKTVGALASAFESIPGPVRTAIGVLLGIGAVAGPILYVIGKVKLLQLELRKARLEGGLMTGVLGKFGKVLGAVGIVATIASFGFAKAREEQENLRAHIQDKLVPAFVEGKLSQEEFTKATEVWVRFGAFTREEIDGWVNGLRTQQTETKKSEQELAKLSRQLQESSDKTKVFANLTKSEFREWRASIRESINPVRSALDKLADKAHLTSTKIIKAFRQQAKNLKEYRENLQDVQKRNIPESVLKQILDMGTEGADILATLADANKTEWRDIVRAMRDARREIRETQNAINGLKGKNVSVGVDVYRPPDSKFGFRAHGGPVYSMRPYVVGERGPEVFVPKQNGDILSNRQVARGGSSLHIGSISVSVVTNSGDPNRLARELVPALEREFSRRQRGMTRAMFGDPV